MLHDWQLEALAYEARDIGRRCLTLIRRGWDKNHYAVPGGYFEYYFWE